MIEEKYKGIHGFINGEPAHASNSWSSVQLFLDTYGFLPSEPTAFDSLSKEQLTELCMLAMDSACRIDLNGQGIKMIQEKLHEFNISPNTKSNE